MADWAIAQEMFFTRGRLDERKSERLVTETLHGFDDGELFLEYHASEALVFDDGRLKNASHNVSQGFGLRSVTGDITAYAHATDLSDAALSRAAATVRSIHVPGTSVALDEGPRPTNIALYPDTNPLDAPDFAAKIALVEEIDGWVRARDPRVRQVTVSLSGERQVVGILRGDGTRLADVRPLVRVNITVVVADASGRMERGSYGMGGREGFAAFIEPSRWRKGAEEALRTALVNLDAGEAPAGEMTVVLGAGWPGVLLHEAVGHGLEGDFNRKGTSAFAGLMGQRIAAPGVTVVDDGTLAGTRGALTIDDEGTPSQCTTLIEDGILVGFIQDRMNARLMGMKPTGNGRRESFESSVLPRMTNTYMLAGLTPPQDIIASVPKGLYAKNFGGGQVDITSGKFVFSATEAYLIENGRVTRPVKGATLVGSGPECLTRVRAIGNDLELDEGIGTCGKDGQSVPVGVGQPTLLIDQLTVGGTAV